MTIDPLARLLLIPAYLFLSLYGLYKLKAAPVGFNLDYVAGLGAYVLGFGLWLVILRLFPLSVAFPVAAGALICGSQFTGVWLLDESLTAGKVAGAVLIVAGIGVLAFSEATARG